MRNCLFIKALNEAHSISVEAPESNAPILTNIFKEAVMERVHNLGRDNFIIGVQTVRHAIALNEQTTKTKLILAGYQFGAGNDLMTILRHELDNILRNPNGRRPFGRNDRVTTLMRRIMMEPLTIISILHMNRGNTRLRDIKEAMELLQDLGLGRIENRQPGRHGTFFTKVTHQILSLDTTLQEALTTLNLNPQTVIRLLRQTEEGANL